MSETPTIIPPAAAPGLWLLVKLRLSLLRNRIHQLLDHNPLQLLLVILFIGTIWGGLYLIFDRVFLYMNRFEEQAVIALPYVFHLFFFSMTLLLSFSTAILIYGSLFGREEPAFLLTVPNSPRNVVVIMFLEAMFFASWSLVLLGLPLMLAIGQAQGLPWHFYVAFIVAFLGFVPIPGAIGLLFAWLVAMYFPRLARKTVIYSIGVVVVLGMVWWGRLWSVSSIQVTRESLDNFLRELGYLKGALLPLTWVSRAIQFSIEDRPGDAAFYLGVTVSTSLCVSWWASMLVGRKLLPAFGRAHATPHRSRVHSGWASRWITRVFFFYLPVKMRELILKDVRNFLRDPLQWSQLAILFGLLALYLFYLPRTRPQGFSVEWQGIICFLNYGAVTLILSTFTSRFVFPMISLEGKQIWLVGLWPMSRGRVMWAKFVYALTVTALAAMSVTALSIRAIDLPPLMAAVQFSATFATCVGLCGLAIGLGARMPNYEETNASRVASGLGGTLNLVSSVGLIAISVGFFGGICWYTVKTGTMSEIPGRGLALFQGLVGLSMGIAGAAMVVGLRSFRRQEF